MDNYREEDSIHNELSEVAITINRPVQTVWERFLDMSSWVTSHTIEELTQPKRSLGAITRVSFTRARELGYPPPHYHYCKIIKLVPLERYVLKTYSEKGGSYGVQIAGFDDARFTASSAGTLLTFAYFGEHRIVEARTRDTAIDMETSVDGMRKNLENLKRLTET